MDRSLLPDLFLFGMFTYFVYAINQMCSFFFFSILWDLSEGQEKNRGNYNLVNKNNCRDYLKAFVSFVILILMSICGQSIRASSLSAGDHGFLNLGVGLTIK